MRTRWIACESLRALDESRIAFQSMTPSPKGGTDGTAWPDRAAIEARLEYRFRDPRLLEEALTHASFSHEESLPPSMHYDRLEFLGDAVVGLLLAEHGYRADPESQSGELSEWRARLARRASLAGAGERLGLGASARLSAGERTQAGRLRLRLLADLFESVVGAIYLDGGLDEARRFVERVLIAGISKSAVRDFKSLLQERVQEGGGASPAYRVLEIGGPPHAPTFLVQVEVSGRALGQGVGGSKQEAEQEAARDALHDAERS